MKYLTAIIWFLIGLAISCINDVIAKFTYINNLSPLEISFYRFFFGTISLIPIIIFYGLKSIKTLYIKLHFLRSFLLALAIYLWISGLRSSQIAVATTINFTIPIFTLILAPLILRESVPLRLWIITIISMIGIFIIISPNQINFFYDSYLLVIAAVLFATLDIINKKYSSKESMICMIFYSSLFTTIILFTPLLNRLKMPGNENIIYLMILGIGSNLILFCLLKAFNTVKISILTPLRYIELIFSIILGYFIFNDVPNYNVVIGTLIIIPTSFYIILKATKQ